MKLFYYRIASFKTASYNFSVWRLPARRLFNQHLSHNTLKNPTDVVTWLGAVQAQDFAMAKWALELRMGNSLTNVISLNGKIVGTWKRVFKKHKVEIKLGLFRSLSKSEQDALEKAATRYGKFLGKPVILT